MNFAIVQLLYTLIVVGTSRALDSTKAHRAILRSNSFDLVNRATFLGVPPDDGDEVPPPVSSTERPRKRKRKHPLPNYLRPCQDGECFSHFVRGRQV